MNELLLENAGQVLAELHTIAKDHAAASGGKLTALEYDPETYASRNILKHTVKGKPLDHIRANETALSVDARYASLYEAMSNCPEVEVIEDVLRSGQNVIFAMDHGELIDAALEPLALANVLKFRNPPKEDEDPYFRTGLIVSRMVEFIGVPMLGGVLPANDLFALGFDRTYQTVPSTISTDGRFNDPAVKTYNNLVINDITGATNRRPFTNRRPMLLALAAPGTINKPLDTAKYNGVDIPVDLQDSTIVVGQINYRVADFAKNALTFASVARLGEHSSMVSIDGTPIHIESPEGIELLARKLIRLLIKRDEDAANYVYDALGNLPVKRR